MRGHNIVSLIVFMLSILVMISSLPEGIGVEGDSSHFKPLEGIFIQSNTDFTAENGVISGSGTADDPYIIEGWDISFNFSLSGNIIISNTTAYFIIRNCRLEEGEFLSPLSISVVTLENVSNGRFENITFSLNGSSIVFAAKSRNCVFKNCDIGFLSFIASQDNQVIYCEFLPGNTYYSGSGIYLDKDCKNNYIHHNNFYVDLGDLGEIISGEKSSGNYWYDDMSKEGNYWIGYDGSDSNGDGIIDTPYDVPGTNDKDLYPLKNPVSSAGNLFGENVQNKKPVAQFSYSPKYPEVGEEIHFIDQSVDRDGDEIVSWLWDFGDGNTSTEQNPTHIYARKSPYLGYNVTLTVVDSRGAIGSTSKPLIVGGGNITNQKPTIRITNPKKDEKVSGKVNITGTASDPDGIISNIQVRVGSKEWYNATISDYNYTTGNVTWYYIWDSSNVIPGEVTIRAKAIDLQGAESNEATVTVMVEKTSSGGGGGTPGFEMALMFLAVLVLSLFKKRQD